MAQTTAGLYTHITIDSDPHSPRILHNPTHTHTYIGYTCAQSPAYMPVVLVECGDVLMGVEHCRGWWEGLMVLTETLSGSGHGPAPVQRHELEAVTEVTVSMVTGSLPLQLAVAGEGLCNGVLLSRWVLSRREGWGRQILCRQALHRWVKAATAHSCAWKTPTSTTRAPMMHWVSETPQIIHITLEKSNLKGISVAV